MFRRLGRATFAALLVATPPRPAPDVGARPAPVSVARPAERQRIAVLVELEETPGALVWARETAARRGRPATESMRVAARAVVARQAARIALQQERVAAALRRPEIGGREIYRVRRALNAIAVRVDVGAVARIGLLPGVKRVRPLPLEYPTNSTSVPFLGAPQVWQNTLGLPLPATGAGVSIGVIDTGVDYQHPAFGGSGLLADYQANDRTVLDAFFPTAKVVGGFDFAGDSYNGNNTPAPDPDPMDCFGHGTHVAATAAGFGVQTDGSTYPGPFDTTTPFSSLRIGPGAAPGATLYALRVFGCGGGTGLTVQAIDWAIDPNGDNDFSDHLDVINLSLGSPNGGTNDATASAAEAAAQAGVIVVASAGNSGDTYFIAGSPGVATAAISVANSADDGIPGMLLQLNSPPSIAGDYPALAAGFVNNPGPPQFPDAPDGETADVVLVDDGVAPASDGCGAGGYVQPALAGQIALVDRGNCGFEEKVRNAQSNGAIAALVANNVAGEPNLITMGCAAIGACNPPITIPSAFVSTATGAAIAAQIPGVNATLLGGGQGVTSADVLNLSSSRGPRRASSDQGPIRLKPDLAAPGTQITSALTGITCTPGGGCLFSHPSGFHAGGLSIIFSGTSMAAPHVAGVMALLRQLHRDWDPEELKALAMNYAPHGLSLGANGADPAYGASRAGAGRVDPALAAPAAVTALNDEDYGAVGVSFESREVVGGAAELRTVRVVNHGASDVTYDLSFVASANDAPGVEFSLPGGSSLVVPAGGTVTFDVRMDATSALMDHAREASVAAIQTLPAPLSGDLARHWLTEEAAWVVLAPPGGGTSLRLPLYAPARPASAMSAGDTIATSGNPTGNTSIPLSGVGVCTGSPACDTATPTDVVSLVTPFELQFASPLDPLNAPAEADLQYGGVAYDAVNGLVLFGFSTWGSWSSPTDTAIAVCVDHDEDGTYDRLLANSNGGTLATAFGGGNVNAQDTFIRGFVTLATGAGSYGGAINLLGPDLYDTRLLDNNVLFMAATPAQLLMTPGDTAFRYKVYTCPGGTPFCARTLTGDRCSPAASAFYDSALGPFAFDYAAPGLDFDPDWLIYDLDGAEIDVAWNTPNLAANGSLGGLLLHHHNVEGTRAEVVLVDSGGADLRLTKSISGEQTVGSDVTFNLLVTNDGPETATGVVVSDPLPLGLSYVSDNGGGAYNPATGLWNAGILGPAASASLDIVATIDTTDAICNEAQTTAGAPLDPDPSDNQSQACALAPRQADLAAAISPDAPNVLSGAPVTFTVDLTHGGGDTAYDVAATVSFPAFPGLAIAGFTASAGTFDTGTGVWSLASLAPASAQTLTVTVDAPSTDGLLTAQVSAASALPDPDNANNSDSASVAVGYGFYSVTPCRVVDTRNPAGPYGGPILAAAASRSFDADAAGCGVPAGAKAISVNATITGAQGLGNVNLFETGIAPPPTAVLSFAPGQTRACNAIVALDAAGSFTVRNASSGATHVIVDVNGYFE